MIALALTAVGLAGFIFGRASARTGVAIDWPSEPDERMPSARLLRDWRRERLVIDRELIRRRR